MSSRMRSASAVLSLLITILFGVAVPLLAQTASSPSPAPINSASGSHEPEQPIVLKEYREILEKERKILEDQSKEYYTRVEKFAYISLVVLGAALFGLIGFFTWMFGQTRKDVVNQIKAELQGAVLSSARDDLERFQKENIDALKSEYERLRERLEGISSFGKQQVIWMLRESMPRPDGEIVALQSVGLPTVATCAPKVDSEEEISEALKKADLAIISFDGSSEAKTLLRHAAAALKFRQPPISLLIYTYDFYLNDRPIQLGADDLEQLKGLPSFAPANFPATLLSQAQSLIIKTRPVLQRRY